MQGDLISRDELLKAIDTWDKFGCDADTKLVPYQDHYIPYIHYDDVIKCIKGMPSVNPQEPTTDTWSIKDVANTLAKHGLIVEQEPCEVLDEINRIGIKAFETYDDYSQLFDFVDSLPPVNPQEQTGHWIEHPEIETSTPEYLMFYECSECGGKQCFIKSDIHKKRFCSNCGFRMVEPQERNNKE